LDKVGDAQHPPLEQLPPGVLGIDWKERCVECSATYTYSKGDVQFSDAFDASKIPAGKPSSAFQQAWSHRPPERLYVLVSDPRMPSPHNLWGTKVARSPEEAQAGFKQHIKEWHIHNPDFHHLRLMEIDRLKRLENNDFDVELS
jgi:hypothetical protein